MVLFVFLNIYIFLKVKFFSRPKSLFDRVSPRSSNHFSIKLFFSVFSPLFHPDDFISQRYQRYLVGRLHQAASRTITRRVWEEVFSIFHSDIFFHFHSISEIFHSISKFLPPPIITFVISTPKTTGHNSL